MKIAFLGKGGSGKSTIATAFTLHALRTGSRVLAIDADHNMDLSFNLGADPTVFIGSDPDAIKEYVGVKRDVTFADALATAQEKEITFRLQPLDSFTDSISMTLSNGVVLMTAGPHTNRVRSGDACSHSLAAPLKVYLPRLILAENEIVVIDERAGTDPVATGILKGVDLAIIVREPSMYSARVAEQIAHELHLAGIAHIIVDNKKVNVAKDAAEVIQIIYSHELMVR